MERYLTLQFRICRLVVIKRIELINFMSHRHTVIEPAAGLTVLVGPNNCGKSAVVAALQILCHNQSSTHVLRHQEKNCQIIVETDDGNVIEWSRKKSGSVKYTINGKVFDRLRSGVPPELHAALRLPKVESDKGEFDVHFGEQKKPVFLLNDSSKAAAEFFASSSDAIRLVEMQARHKMKIRDAKRDQKELEKSKTEVQESLEVLEPVSELDKRLLKCEKQFTEIFVEAQEIKQLERTLNQIYLSGKQLVYQQEIEFCFDELPVPPQYEPTEVMAKLVEQIQVTEQRAKRDNANCNAFEGLSHPPVLQPAEQLRTLLTTIKRAQVRANVDSAKLNQLDKLKPMIAIDELSGLRLLVDEIRVAEKTVQQVDKRATANAKHLIGVTKEIESWAASNPTCPTCRGSVSAQNLVQHICEEGGDHDAN